LVSSWKEYSSTIVSNEILRSPVANSTVIQNSVDTTSVIVDNGDYRATFHAQFDILDGLCECASDLLALVDDLETNTFTVHGAAYGYSDVISPGLYSCAGATTHTGTLYIDADGDPDAVFVFLAAGAHAIAASASTILLNNAQACNIFWVVVGALSIGAGCTLRGTYIGKAAVAAGALFVLEGRLFTTGGAIALAAVTADVPLGVSQYNFRSLASYLFYSVAGAISTPSYTSTSGVTWSISTSLGIVSGFGAPHDGTFPISMSPHVKISFGIYKGDTLVPVSLVYVETDALGSNFHIDTAANITVDTNEDKTITARVDILSDMGGVIVGNRTLFLMPLV
jgi:hypothetical protein